MKRGLTGLAVMLCWLGIYVVAAEGEDKATHAKPCVTITGANSHVSERSYHRITSIEGWTQIWQKHKGQKDDDKYDYYYDPLELPLVDFDNYMVIGIFQGSSWNSAGLKSVSISEEDDRIVFRFDDKPYQTEGLDGGGKEVTVYGFFVIPRSSKPVILEENVQGIIGKPPVWKERIEFEKMQGK